jgi:hypothetical protein
MPGPSRESGSPGGGFAPPPPKKAAVRNETAILHRIVISYRFAYQRKVFFKERFACDKTDCFYHKLKKPSRQNQPADIEKNQRGSSGILLPEPLFI